MLTDTHCHLSELTDSQLEAVLTNAEQNDVSRMIAIGAGYGVEQNCKTLDIAQRYPHIFCALGMHPHDAKDVTPENLAQLGDLIKSSPKVVAVGEIGLDYHYMNSDKITQQRVFEDYIDLALGAKKPVVIHDRDCDFDAVNTLKAKGADQIGGIVHCFSGTWELAQRYLDLGFYVSFSGIITFKKADDLREVVKKVPLERLLIETDSPFLAPVPYRGKTNEPAYVKFVAQEMARLRGVSYEDIGKQTTENAKRLFKTLNSLN